MCMQTLYGCCLIDGEVINSKEKLKKRDEKSKSKEKKKMKKVIHQSEVGFE